jgi:hypothetical protein
LLITGEFASCLCRLHRTRLAQIADLFVRQRDNLASRRIDGNDPYRRCAVHVIALAKNCETPTALATIAVTHAIFWTQDMGQVAIGRGAGLYFGDG